MSTFEIIKLNKFYSFRGAELSYDNLSETALVTTRASLVPMKDFQEIFSKAEEMIIRYELSRLIFDKRSLEGLSNAVMDWFYLEWKTKMYVHHGLLDHRKLLPANPHFRKSFELKKNSILANNPHSDIQHINIRYYESLEKAFE